jgi:hypothetical protein
MHGSHTSGRCPLRCRHILELYGVKETADNAADAAGAPRQGIHSAIYKHYLQQASMLLLLLLLSQYLVHVEYVILTCCLHHCPAFFLNALCMPDGLTFQLASLLQRSLFATRPSHICRRQQWRALSTASQSSSRA